MSKTKSFAYTGCENLEVMTEAKNYNKFLIGLVLKAVKKTGKKDPKTLDFGAGSGTYSDMLKDQGFTPDCLEPDKKLHKILKSKGYKTYESIKNLGTTKYDVIYALNVFEHIEDDHATLEELAKHLKKGGHLVVYVPAFQMLFTSMDEKVGHYRRYRIGRLKGMAKQAGLKTAELRYCDPLGFGATIAYKAIGNSEGTISTTALKIYDRTVFPLSRAGHPITGKAFGKNVVLIAKK